MGAQCRPLLLGCEQPGAGWFGSSRDVYAPDSKYIAQRWQDTKGPAKYCFIAEPCPSSTPRFPLGVCFTVDSVVLWMEKSIAPSSLFQNSLPAQRSQERPSNYRIPQEDGEGRRIWPLPLGLWWIFDLRALRKGNTNSCVWISPTSSLSSWVFFSKCH